MRRAAATIVLLQIVGCTPDREIPCRPGFTIAQDGHCYPPPPDPEPPSVNDVLENIGPCVPKKPGDAIEIAIGCIEGACANDRFESVDDALGDDVECENTGTDWYCIWPQHVEALFTILEDDIVLPAPDTITPFVRAGVGYAGTNADGLGMGISPRCFVDVLGAPSEAEFVDTAGQLEARQLLWDSYGIEIEDEQDPGGVDLPDGDVDEITLFGPA